jgi:DNA-binding NarL/FixJ family response regulator
VIVLDVHAAGATLCDAVRTLLDSRPRTAVLLVGGEEDKTTALRAITAGARAYLPSHVPTELVVQVVRTIAEGGLVLPGGIARDMARQLVRELDERDAVVQLLSEREHGVLVLLGSGRSNAEIAQELFISEATVKKHVSQILRKLRRRDRLQAALYASELGLGHEPPPAPEHTG